MKQICHKKSSAKLYIVENNNKSWTAGQFWEADSGETIEIDQKREMRNDKENEAESETLKSTLLKQRRREWEKRGNGNDNAIHTETISNRWQQPLSRARVKQYKRLYAHKMQQVGQYTVNTVASIRLYIYSYTSIYNIYVYTQIWYTTKDMHTLKVWQMYEQKEILQWYWECECAVAFLILEQRTYLSSAERAICAQSTCDVNRRCTDFAHSSDIKEAMLEAIHSVQIFAILVFCFQL